MMNVSFGRFIYTEEKGARNTAKQRKCIDVVGDIIDNPYNENELALNLEKKKDANLCMDVNKNGTIDLYVNKEMLGWEEYIPYDKNGRKKLFTRVNVNSSLSAIKKQVTSFMKKCREYAEAIDCKKNEDIEEKNLDEACTTGSRTNIKAQLKDIALYEDLLSSPDYTDSDIDDDYYPIADDD